jgi:adenine-specific DNA-methyltransferase
MNKKELLDKVKSLDGLSTEEKAYLINLVNTKKKYGLVWEDKPENVEEKLRTHLPVLKEVKERAIINDTKTEKHPNHILIEGDNLHALTSLTFTHEGKIDLIYIDPPYNTGNKAEDGTTDFKYDDDYVDSEDVYRHSKWLSFISKRLVIAKKLLADDGFLAISIDDNEIAQLKILLDNLFNEQTKTIAIKMSEASGLKMSSVYRLGTIPKFKEYLLIAKPNGVKNLFFEDIPKSSWDTEYNIFLKGFSIKLYNQVKNLNERGDITKEEITILDQKIKSVELISISQIHKELGLTKKADKENWNFENSFRICQCATSSSVLRLAKEKKKINSNPIFFAKSVRDGKLYFIRATFNPDSKKPRVQLIFAKDNLSSHPGDFWSDIKTTGLEAEGGVGFKNGKKPLKLLNRILGAHKKSNIKILDFFAGSGSTMHSAMDLNNKDGGEREVILVTNNENKICENITYKRIYNVIRGYDLKSNEGKELKKNNLRYYQTKLVERNPNLSNKRKLIQFSTELLCIKEDCYTEVTSHLENASWHKYFTNGSGNFVYVIYDDMYIEDGVSHLSSFIEGNPGAKIKVYVFANGPYPYTEEFESIANNIELAALPDAIYKAYQNVLPKQNKDFIPELEEESPIEFEH